MRLSTKTIISTTLALSLLVPAFTQAASLTSAQVSSVIGLLQSFNVDSRTIDTVQMVLNGNGTPGSEASSTPWHLPPGQLGKLGCIALARNLGVGSRGEDVRSLQELLAHDSTSGFQGSTTGYYGPKTADAMRRFQLNNGIASSTTGAVGPATRGFFERRCGKGLGNGSGGDDNGPGGRPQTGEGSSTPGQPGGQPPHP